MDRTSARRALLSSLPDPDYNDNYDAATLANSDDAIIILDNATINNTITITIDDTDDDAAIIDAAATNSSNSGTATPAATITLDDSPTPTGSVGCASSLSATPSTAAGQPPAAIPAPLVPGPPQPPAVTRVLIVKYCCILKRDGPIRKYACATNLPGAFFVWRIRSARFKGRPAQVCERGRRPQQLCNPRSDARRGIARRGNDYIKAAVVRFEIHSLQLAPACYRLPV